MPDGRLAIGTRCGELFLVSGAFAENPRPEFSLFASGLDEVMGSPIATVRSRSHSKPKSRESAIPTMMVAPMILQP